jgi:tRNA-Thr(GGU) m(6)t(6)A37 methyltransferase TsaA
MWMDESRYEIIPVGRVDSSLTNLSDAPPQGDEGAPDAAILIRPELRAALNGLEVGDDVVVVTWLDRGDRATLEVHPRGDLGRPPRGVFATRSPDRPNPIGLHTVRVLAIDGTTLIVAGLEAVNGTPVVDVKPVLGPIPDR